MNDINRHHILIVEDDRDTCELLRHVLPEWKLTISHTIAGAVSHYLENHFDLVMLDNWLPDGSGVELCRKVRELNFAAPIIFVSGAAHEKDVEDAIASGATKYLTKPCEPDTLKQVVKELVA